MLLLNVEVHFFEKISNGNANLSELPRTLNIYSGNIVVTFVLRIKGALVCNSSMFYSVLVLNRTSPSLLHTFVVDTLLNFPLAFNIPVILSYTNTSHVNAFGRLLGNPRSRWWRHRRERVRDRRRKLNGWQVNHWVESPRTYPSNGSFRSHQFHKSE